MEKIKTVVPMLVHLEAEVAKKLAEHLDKVGQTKKEFINELLKDYFKSLKP